MATTMQTPLQPAPLSTSDSEKRAEQFQISWVKIVNDPNTVNLIGSPSFSFSGSSFPPDMDEADSVVDGQFYCEQSLRHASSDQESFYHEEDSYKADSSANFSVTTPNFSVTTPDFCVTTPDFSVTTPTTPSEPMMAYPNDTDDEKFPLDNFSLPEQMSTSSYDNDENSHHQMSARSYDENATCSSFLIQTTAKSYDESARNYLIEQPTTARSFDERSCSSFAESETSSVISSASKNVTNNGIPKLLIPCRFYGSARGCSLSDKCLYSHDNPSCVRLCINFFSSGCGYKEQCRFRHTKNSADNMPSKQQSLRDRFRNRFGVTDGDEYFTKFLKISPEANIIGCELAVGPKLPNIPESLCCCSCSHNCKKAQRENSEANFSPSKPLRASSTC